MATGKRNKSASPTKPKVGYRVASIAIENPRRYYIATEKVFVGVGGSINVIPPDGHPKGPYTIPEATPAQYMALSKHSPLVQRVEDYS